MYINCLKQSKQWIDFANIFFFISFKMKSLYYNMKKNFWGRWLEILIHIKIILGCIKWHFICLFSSPDPKGHVSYCHHLASVVVARRKLFQKSSPLKVLDQWKPNLVWIITRVSSFKIVSGDAVHQPTLLLLLKTEHMVKLQVFGQ